MRANLEGTILEALFNHFESYPGAPKMTFSKLYEAIGIPQPDKKTKGKVRQLLFALQGKEWIEYKSLADGQAGTAKITPDGIEVAKDRRKNIESKTNIETPKFGLNSQEPSKSSFHEIEPLTPCPTSVEQLIKNSPSCARIILRYDLQQEIISYFEQEVEKCHFIVLYGQPMVGKTKTLVRLSEKLQNKYIPLMVTGKGIGFEENELDDFDDFAFNLADQLTNKFRKWAKRIGLPILNRPKWNEFKGKGKDAFEEHWEKLRKIAGQKQPLLIIDEIERLLEFEGDIDVRIFTFIDYFVSDPDNGCFILAGSERIRRSKNKKFSVLIAKGMPVKVGHYDDQNVLNIFYHIQEYITYEHGVLQYFLALCDGHPRVLHFMLKATLTLVSSTPGKQRIEKSDIEPILMEILDGIDELLWGLGQRLSREELFVVSLISQRIPSPTGEFEYSLNELLELADQYFPDATVDRNFIKKGIVELAKREWVEWKDWDKELFRFKLAIFLLWIQRHHIILDEVTY